MNEPDIRRQERIEAYVGGTLSGVDLNAFEAELARDELLRQEVEVERTLAATLQRGHELRFRDLVEQVSAEQERGATTGGGMEKPVIPIDRGRWRWLAAAASVAVLIGVGVALWLSEGAGRQDHAQFAYMEIQVEGQRDLRHTDIVDSVFMKLRTGFTRELSRRTFTHTMEADLVKALESSRFNDRYGQETRTMIARIRISRSDFKEALETLDSVDGTKTQPCDVRFYRAVALLGMGDRSSAEDLLNAADCPYPEVVLVQLLGPY